MSYPIVGIGSLYVTKSRAEVVSYTVPLDYSAQRIFIKNPSHIYNYTAYLEPLTCWSWISIMIFLLTSSSLLFAITRLGKEPIRTSIIESFEAVYSALIMMDSPFQPSKFTTKVIFGRWVISNFWHNMINSGYRNFDWSCPVIHFLSAYITLR